ncbi:putative chitobiose transport system substrate-binding protein [Paenibacillus rhizosphaerae]|uniref:Putative chitobiose transport system substrate-binding protein n=1 Tax=Paenibacillus rhizosphaerae TaxID=297318 RepID=A0A839TSS3_9BACL|nr:sugar ABC transporter substrate-binding protein [Paenibacillus rhizosphaerae]MBB3128428.1 putative chitobiose transport system substrate-binding protein [Paenibacillus rhizosphaerae]
MVKKALAIILVCALCFALAACGGNSSNSQSAGNGNENGSGQPANSGETEKKDPVTIEFWTLSLQPTFTNYVNGVIKDFETQYPYITVKWVDLPYDAMQQKLVAQIAGSKAPDVVNVWTTLLLGMAGKDALVDLRKEATPEQLSIYQESLNKSNEFGGGLYGFPWYVTPPISTYNTELFKKAGLDHPPVDYTEMFEMAKVMKEKTGAYLYFPNEMCQVLYSNGIQLLNEDKTAAAFNTPETLKLLTELQNGVKEGWMPRTDWNNWDNMIKLYAQDKLALISLGAQTVTRIQNEAPGSIKKTAVAPPLLGTAGIAQGALQSLAIPKASKHHEEAILFANFLTNDKNQLAFDKLAAIMPTTNEAAKDSFFTSDTETLEGRARAEAAKATAVSFDLGLGVEKESDVVSTINGMFESIMQANKDPQKVLDETEAKVNELLK